MEVNRGEIHITLVQYGNNYSSKKLTVQSPGANVIKLFTSLIYSCS